MGLRGSLAMLVLLAGLGVALWLSEAEAPSGDQVLTDPVLDGRSVVDAARIAVQPDPDGPWIEFAAGADRVWRVVEPVRDLASQAVLDNLRGAYDTAQLVVAYEPGEVDERLLAETGLDRPRGRFRAEWPDGAVVELALGLPSPRGEDLFARRVDEGAGGRIHRVHRALSNALQLTPDDARERMVFTTVPAQLTGLRLTRRGIRSDGREDVLGLVRRGGGFALDEPAGLRVDQAGTAGLVQALLGLRVDRFLPGRPQEGLSPVGPERPADVTIEVSGAPATEVVELYFVGERTGLVGVHHGRGIWFSCDARGYDRVVEVPVEALRARWLFTTAFEAATTLRLRPPGGPVLELERRPAGAYRLARPIAYKADPTAVAELLQGLRSLAVLEFADDAPSDPERYGLGDGALELQIEERPGRGDRLLVGADTGLASTFVRRADEPQVVTVPREAAERLRRPWWTYVDRQVLRIESGGLVRRILRRLPDGSEVAFARGDDGGWRRGGAGEPLPLVADTFDLLRDLRAAEVLPGSGFAAAADEGSLELLADADQVLGRLALARGADGRVAVAIADAPGLLFVLGPRDSRDLLELR